MVPGKKYTVFAIRTRRPVNARSENIWVRAGIAYVNTDGSMNVTLDVLPIDGQLHIRETGGKDEAAAGGSTQEL